MSLCYYFFPIFKENHFDNRWPANNACDILTATKWFISQRIIKRQVYRVWFFFVSLTLFFSVVTFFVRTDCNILCRRDCILVNLCFMSIVLTVTYGTKKVLIIKIPWNLCILANNFHDTINYGMGQIYPGLIHQSMK